MMMLGVPVVEAGEQGGYYIQESLGKYYARAHS